MTALEMLYEFNLKFAEFSPLEAPTTYQVEYFLNDSQTDILNEIILNGWDRTEQTRKAVSRLLKTSNLTPDVNSPVSGTVWYNMPTDCRFITSEYCNITYNSNNPVLEGVSKSMVKVKPAREDYYLFNKDNPFKVPDHTVVWKLEGNSTDRRLILFKNIEYDIDSYTIRYLKYPNRITLITSPEVGSDLDESVHPKIVDLAVQIARQAIMMPNNDKQ